MNNFIFENSTKVFFGKGCVKEYLCCLTKAYGDKSIFLRLSRYAFVYRLFCCPKVGYN